MRSYTQGVEQRRPWLARDNMVRLDLVDGTRLLARPSGTEPKLKIYADLRLDYVGGDLWQLMRQGEQRCEELAKAIRTEMEL